VKPVYLGVFLDNASSARLAAWFHKSVMPLHVEQYCHHLTVAFKPTPEQIEAFPFKAHCSLHVVGIASDAKAQAVVVRPSCAFPVTVQNAHPHITVACAEGVKPFYSNELIAASSLPVIGGPVVGGYCGWWDGKEPRFEKPVSEPDTAKLSSMVK
jgi:hypothetical protein